jgi:hypothetical protein
MITLKHISVIAIGVLCHRQNLWAPEHPQVFAFAHKESSTGSVVTRKRIRKYSRANLSRRSLQSDCTSKGKGKGTWSYDCEEEKTPSPTPSPLPPYYPRPPTPPPTPSPSNFPSMNPSKSPPSELPPPSGPTPSESPPPTGATTPGNTGPPTNLYIGMAGGAGLLLSLCCSAAICSRRRRREEEGQRFVPLKEAVFEENTSDGESTDRANFAVFPARGFGEISKMDEHKSLGKTVFYPVHANFDSSSGNSNDSDDDYGVDQMVITEEENSQFSVLGHGVYTIKSNHSKNISSRPYDEDPTGKY